MNLTCNYGITWHYDISKDQVIVTNADVKLVRKDPEKYADMTNGKALNFGETLKYRKIE